MLPNRGKIANFAMESHKQWLSIAVLTNTIYIFMQEKIIILDFGSQTTQLIGRRVRELNMYCEIVP